MKRYIISFLTLTAASLAVLAYDVNCTEAGNLQNFISEPESITELNVKGSINAKDLFYISENLTELTELDLSGATISAYSGPRLGQFTTYSANTMPSHVFTGSKIQTITLPVQEGLIIGNAAFAGSALKEITLPKTLASVGDGAFTACPQLETAEIASDNIGQGLFASCPKLKSVTIACDMPATEHLFADCPSLETVEGSNYFTAINSGAFLHCSGLKSFDFGAKLTTIGDKAFTGSGLKIVNLAPASKLQSIGEWAFAQMPELETINFGSVAECGDAVLFDCPSLQTVVFSANMDVVPAFSLAKTSSLTQATISEGISGIAQHALSASGLKKITLPKTLSNLEDNAMERMANLSEINVTNPVFITVGNNVWENVDQKSVNLFVPAGTENDYKAHEQWGEFNVVSVSGANDEIISAPLASLTGRFSGEILQLRLSSDSTIDAVALYEPSGRLVLATAPYAADVDIDTEGISGKLFICAVTLSDGTVATLKLSK